MSKNKLGEKVLYSEKGAHIGEVKNLEGTSRKVPFSGKPTSPVVFKPKYTTIEFIIDKKHLVFLFSFENDKCSFTFFGFFLVSKGKVHKKRKEEKN